MSRRAAKIDATQPEIVAELERLGCAVRSTAGEGNGFPDLVVWYLDRHHLVEVKGKRGKLTQKQKDFMRDWPGAVWIVRDKTEAMAIVQQWEKESGK